VHQESTTGRVLVVDDHQAYAEAVAVALTALVEGPDAVHVNDAAAALTWIDSGEVDIVLLDWQLGDDDGIELTRQITQRRDAPDVVVVTAHHSESLDRLARQAGASAALPKHASMSTMIATIERCRAGDGRPEPQPPAEDPDGSGATHPAAARLAAASDRDNVLSPRQVEVLWMLSDGADISSVAATLHLSVSTVRTYLKDAYRRLGVHSQLEAVAVARREGLIPSAPPAIAAPG
jgi:DNA-binding NarL/FixJ family response regulator